LNVLWPVFALVTRTFIIVFHLGYLRYVAAMRKYVDASFGTEIRLRSTYRVRDCGVRD